MQSPGHGAACRQKHCAVADVMRPPRLLHILSSFTPGGAELLLVSVMNALGVEFEHTVVPLNGRAEAAGLLRVPCRVLAPPPGWSSPTYAWRLRRLITRERPELTLTYNWGAIDAVIGLAASAPCPVIHNEHGFGAEEAARLKRRRTLIRRWFLNRIYSTVVVSEQLHDIALKRYRLAPEKVRYIRNGIDIEEFQPRPKNIAWRRQHGIADEALVIGFLGVLRPEKRLGFLLKAFAEAQLPGAVLALVGEGPRRGELEQQARELGLGGRVVFAGYTGRPAEALAGFDVFAMSSSTEQSPTALMQAMSSGLPVIATDVGDCAALVGGGEPWVVDPADAAGYVERLRRLASAEERAWAGSRNRRRAVKEFSHHRMVAEYGALYREAIASFRR